MRSGAGSLGLAAVLTLLAWRTAESVIDNVDRLEPVVRMSPEDGSSGDQFGFALALHSTEDIAEDDSPQEAAGKTRVVVGAPVGTYPGGLDLSDPGEPAVNRTGLIYDCSIIPNRDEPCGPVLGDDVTGTTVNGLNLTVDNDLLSAGGRLFDHRPNALVLNEFGFTRQAEQKRGQFLGATVHSRNGRLIACAPIWVSTGAYNSSISPDGNFPASSNVLPQGRCYVTNQQLREVTFLDPCNLLGEQSVTVDKGYCTSGTDVDMLEPGRFIVGSPGYKLGIGTVFYGRSQEEMVLRNNPTSGQGNIRHFTPAEGEQEIREVSQGFQVATGFITISRTDPPTPPPNVLASVPRFDSTNYLGKIDIYDARESGGNIQDLLQINILGTQIGEFFGYALDTLDINGDMYDEVVVGAPMYSQINPTSDVKFETGRVYVFINNAGNYTEPPVVFEGTVSRARLGMSVLSVGDIDQDGFEDFAVGAPYEADGDSTGVVYIFYGNSDITAFRNQIPARVSSQETADRLRDIDNFTSFGFSLASLDFDNNKHNDLAIGAPESSAVVLLRSRPVANVVVELLLSTEAVVRAEQVCSVRGTNFACFMVTVRLTFTGQGLPHEIQLSVSLREVRSNGEARIFFGDNPANNQMNRTVTVQQSSGGVAIVAVYLLNGITDSESPLELMAEVLPNTISQSSSLGDGHPEISDLSQDFLIRQPTSLSRLVNLTNNCGPDNACQTDFAISSGAISYLPDRGLNYQTVEVGGVEMVRVDLTLSNQGMEDAIVLLLNISHNVLGVFTDNVKIEIDGAVLDCTPSIGPCNVRDVFAERTQDIGVLLEVGSDAPVGTVNTTFTLSSTATTDTGTTSNNSAIVSIVVDRRADLKISVIFPQEQVMYGTERVKSPSARSEVGALVSMEVRVSNVRSTDVENAVVSIFYPASSPETGEYFYLLPDCGVSSLITEGGRIECGDSHLEEVESLECDSARRRRHAVSPSVKQRWRRARETSTAAGLIRRTRATSSLDCSSNPGGCLVIRCNITGLRGLGRNEAKISVRGYVDERFFFDKDQQYELTALANVTFDTEAEGTIDQRLQPDSGSATVTVSPPIPDPSPSRESRLTLIFVIIAVIIGPIIIITIITLILWRCGFFKRKRPEEEGGDVVPEDTAAIAAIKPAEGTTL